MAFFRHKKTGKLYSLISENFMFKDQKEIIIDSDRSICYKIPGELEWRKGLVLYKAEYENPDGPYFARTREDFYENFEPVDNEEVINIVFQ